MSLARLASDVCIENTGRADGALSGTSEEQATENPEITNSLPPSASVNNRPSSVGREASTAKNGSAGLIDTTEAGLVDPENPSHAESALVTVDHTGVSCSAGSELSAIPQEETIEDPVDAVALLESHPTAVDEPATRLQVPAEPASSAANVVVEQDSETGETTKLSAVPQGTSKEVACDRMATAPSEVAKRSPNGLAPGATQNRAFVGRGSKHDRRSKSPSEGSQDRKHEIATAVSAQASPENELPNAVIPVHSTVGVAFQAFQAQAVPAIRLPRVEAPPFDRNKSLDAIQPKSLPSRVPGTGDGQLEISPSLPNEDGGQVKNLFATSVGSTATVPAPNASDSVKAQHEGGEQQAVAVPSLDASTRHPAPHAKVALEGPGTNAEQSPVHTPQVPTKEAVIPALLTADQSSDSAWSSLFGRGTGIEALNPAKHDSNYPSAAIPTHDSAAQTSQAQVGGRPGEMRFVASNREVHPGFQTIHQLATGQPGMSSAMPALNLGNPREDGFTPAKHTLAQGSSHVSKIDAGKSTAGSATNLSSQGADAHDAATTVHTNSDSAPALAPREVALADRVPGVVTNAIVAQPQGQALGSEVQSPRMSFNPHGEVLNAPVVMHEGHALSLNTSRLIQTMTESEMRIGFGSAEFGNLSVRTTINAQQLAAQITVDHGDLSKALNAHLPAVQEKLVHQFGLNTSIEIRSQDGSISTGTGQQSQGDDRRIFDRVPIKAGNRSEPRVESSTALVSEVTNGRLDIRA
ncbi:hypothetical protein DYQ86_00130 [Acidobacteria bacterium AB60]|nr:hypothetical protein DYQ86_00130 [Acidobacteria bacterium AB60]